MSSGELVESGRVLVVDDEVSEREDLTAVLTSRGYSVEVAENGQKALEMLVEELFDVVIADLMMPVMDGFELLKRIQNSGLRVPVIINTAYGNFETAIACVHELGAFWFFDKPVRTAELEVAVQRAVQTHRLQSDAARQLSQQCSANLGLIGSSHQISRIRELIRAVAPKKARVLLIGESGTGKDVAARAIHQLSSRRSAPFIALNCAAMPESLIESELFGHEKGAFTGAVERRAGCFEIAHGGTLFLDEITEMPLHTQAKLLRAVQEARIRRLGGKHEIPIDVRIIAATNRDPLDAIKDRLLREDLYYRLNVFRIEMAPLRQHPDDIAELIRHFLPRAASAHECQVDEVSSDVFKYLEAYPWPGNVRELENMVERAVILAGNCSSLGVDHFPDGLVRTV